MSFPRYRCDLSEGEYIMLIFPLLNETASSCVFILRMGGCVLLANTLELSFEIGLAQLSVQIIRNQNRYKSLN